ncbi:MAG: hypothetical protein QOD00_1988 [Blastocatellia bacterium]|nr:hypothetical protein [Blastocatellia bacterium]
MQSHSDSVQSRSRARHAQIQKVLLRCSAFRQFHLAPLGDEFSDRHHVCLNPSQASGERADGGCGRVFEGAGARVEELEACLDEMAEAQAEARVQFA